MFHSFPTFESCGTDEGGDVRIYALTLKNKMVAAFFCGVTVPQFVLGTYFIFIGATNPGMPLFLTYPASSRGAEK